MYYCLSLLLPAPPRRRDLTSKFGIDLTFVSTRSGLTRFEDFSNGSSVVEKFKQLHTKSIDEEFYKRAVDYHAVNDTAFIFSVPINIGDYIRVNGEADLIDETLDEASTLYGGYTPSNQDDLSPLSLDQVHVTASRAIFVGENKETAPVAVVGALIKIATFRETFFNETVRCGAKNCAVKCEDETTHCLVVDNNGYIIVSENVKYTGKYLGEFDDVLLESLITHQIYTRKKVRDYQAICIETYTISGPGGRLLAPFKYIINTLVSLWSRILFAAIDTFITGAMSEELIVDEEAPDLSSPLTPAVGDGVGGPGASNEPIRRFITKTKPRPCIQEIELLEGSSKFFSNSDTSKIITSQCNSCQQKTIVQQIPNTNLLSIVVMNACDCSASSSAYSSSSSSSSAAANGVTEDITGRDEYNTGESRKLQARTVALSGECSALPSFYRQRPNIECIASHPDEEEIKICGLAISNLKPGSLSFITSIIATGVSMVFLVIMTQG